MGLYLIFDDGDRQFDMEKAMGMGQREIVRGDEAAFEEDGKGEDDTMNNDGLLQRCPKAYIM